MLYKPNCTIGFFPIPLPPLPKKALPQEGHFTLVTYSPLPASGNHKHSGIFICRGRQATTAIAAWTITHSEDEEVVQIFSVLFALIIVYFSALVNMSRKIFFAMSIIFLYFIHRF